MEVQTTHLPDVLVVCATRHADVRGFFSESYHRRRFAEHGIDLDFVQDNFSRSAHANTIRGLHFQIPPHPQAKLIRVLRGSILDVAVDLRVGSPTRFQHVAIQLNADDGHQLYVPIGFAHGFRTLEPNTEVLYKVSDYYSPSCDRGVRWNDPQLAIPWGVDERSVVLSERDAKHPFLSDLLAYFPPEISLAPRQPDHREIGVKEGIDVAPLETAIRGEGDSIDRTDVAYSEAVRQRTDLKPSLKQQV